MGRLKFARPAISGVIVSFLLATGTGVSQWSRGDDAPAKTSSKAATDSTHESPEEADLDVDEDLSALIVPVRFLGKLKEADRLQYLQEVRGLLAEGFKAKGDGLDGARKHLTSAHRLLGDDPRADYSYALVLTAQNKSALALEQFRVAAKSKKVPFLPGLQGIAWTSLSRGEYLEAFAALFELARRLEQSRESWPTEQDKENSAEWLGRVVGFLAGPGKTEAQAAPIDKLVADVSKLLTGDRSRGYENGRKMVLVRQQELQALAARPAEEVLAEVQQKREEIVAAAAAAESEAKQLEEEIRELKKPHDKRIADLGRQIRTSAATIKSTEPKIQEAQAEVEEFSTPKKHAQLKSQGMRRPAKVVARDENSGEKKIREGQLATAQKKLDRLQETLDTAHKRIADAKKQRDDARAEFRKATAEKRQALQAAQHKAAELAARAREAERGALTSEKLKARLTSLEAYVPLYPELEKERLLATLTTAP
jgi:hypothetical protein